MDISAIILMALNTIGLIWSPFLVGKPREPYQPSFVISCILGFVLTLFVCGRIFGWF
jgi:hypothetical protein